MIHIEPYQPFHMHLLLAQGVQPMFVGRISYVPGVSDRLGHMGTALAAIQDGRVLCVGGLIPIGPRIGHLWAVLSAEAGQHMLSLHRATRRFLSCQIAPRIEATVEMGFAPGCRWLTLLGFECETPNGMRGFGEDGGTYLLFSKVS